MMIMIEQVILMILKKMNRLNNNYESLDYYWEVIIEEL